MSTARTPSPEDGTPPTLDQMASKALDQHRRGETIPLCDPPSWRGFLDATPSERLAEAERLAAGELPGVGEAGTAERSEREAEWWAALAPLHTAIRKYIREALAGGLPGVGPAFELDAMREKWKRGTLSPQDVVRCFDELAALRLRAEAAERRASRLRDLLVEERARLVYDPSCVSPEQALKDLDALRAQAAARVQTRGMP